MGEIIMAGEQRKLRCQLRYWIFGRCRRKGIRFNGIGLKRLFVQDMGIRI
jgi:hypothetical protein